MDKKGFTLIELLIVITIIGVLAVALLPRIVGIPARGRDTARIAAMNQIVTALQTYYNDFGKFPPSLNNGCLGTVVDKYLGGSSPIDPQGSSRFHLACKTGAYYYKSLKSSDSTAADQGFVLAADLEADGYGLNYFNSAVITDAKFINLPAPANLSSSVADDLAITGASNVYAIIR